MRFVVIVIFRFFFVIEIRAVCLLKFRARFKNGRIGLLP